jgi:hypothetical protein
MRCTSSFIASVQKETGQEEIRTWVCGIHSSDYEEYSLVGCNSVVQRTSKVLDELITSVFRVEE